MGRSITRTFWLFACVWCLVWTLVPLALLPNDYIDVLENVVWGRHWAFGYDKNPYFGAWLTRLAYLAAGQRTWPAAVLSALSILLALWAVFRLAAELLPDAHALVATLFLAGIPFYGYHAVEFNDDVMELALWALAALHVHRAVRTQRLLSWAWTGLLAGLTLMTKYYGLVLLASLGLLLLAEPQARRSWRHPGIYVAATLAGLICLPNLLWLWHHQFVAVDYALTRAGLAGAEGNWFRHVAQPVRLLAKVLGIALPPLAACLLCFPRREPVRRPVPAFDLRFVTVLALGPLSLTVLFAALTGGRVRYTWLTPCFHWLGVLVCLLWQPRMTRIGLRAFAGLVTAALLGGGALFAHGLLVAPYLEGKGGYETFPGRAVARILTERWRERYRTALPFVAGDRKLTCNIAVCSSDRPLAYFDWNPRLSPWVQEEELLQRGALFVWHCDQGPFACPPAVARRFPHLEWLPALQLPWAVPSWGGRLLGLRPLPPVTIHAAFLPPAGAAPPP